MLKLIVTAAPGDTVIVAMLKAMFWATRFIVTGVPLACVVVVVLVVVVVEELKVVVVVVKVVAAEVVEVEEVEFIGVVGGAEAVVLTANQTPANP